MTEQLQFPFPSLDFPGRVTLRVEEIAAKLDVTSQHVIDLIVEGKLRANDVRGLGSVRALYRVPLECWRDFILATLTDHSAQVRLLREMPKATLRQLRHEIDQLLVA